VPLLLRETCKQLLLRFSVIYVRLPFLIIIGDARKLERQYGKAPITSTAREIPQENKVEWLLWRVKTDKRLKKRWLKREGDPDKDKSNESSKNDDSEESFKEMILLREEYKNNHDLGTFKISTSN
jgi:hypothetical protein